MNKQNLRLETIYKRKSTRCFEKNYVIPKDVQELILTAGLQAPSPKNRQPWFYIMLENKDSLKKTSDIMQEKLNALKEERLALKLDCSDLEMAMLTADLLCNCSLLLFICYERDPANEHGESLNWPLSAQGFEVTDLQAIGASIQNMLLQATELSVDSLWIGDVLYAHDELQAYLGTSYPFVAAVAFGKATTDNNRKRLSEKTLWFDEK